MRLRTRAPAKINVCLFLGPPRADGRHELVSVMQSVALADRVALDPNPDGAGDEVVCPGVDGPNLAAEALSALPRSDRLGGRAGAHDDRQARSPWPGGWRAARPTRARRCGCASHAAGVKNPELLLAIAAELGADVPAQVKPGRVLATGAGEVLRRVPGTAPYSVVVVADRRPLSTADVFAEADRLGLPRDGAELAAALTAVEAALPDLPDELCVNELAPATLSLRPDLAERLDALRAAGADVAMVSGSGPTVLGLFRDAAAAETAALLLDGALVTKPVGPQAGEVLGA